MSASGWHRKRNDAAAQARAVEYRSARHKAAEAQIKRQVEAGAAYCWRCGNRLLPGKDRHGKRLWHVGHSDDWTRIVGGECAPCNLKAAASKGARVANARRKQRRSPTSRAW